jgi:hypothetical protein
VPQVRTRVPGPKMIRFQCIFLIIPASFYGQECLSASQRKQSYFRLRLSFNGRATTTKLGAYL